MYPQKILVEIELCRVCVRCAFVLRCFLSFMCVRVRVNVEKQRSQSECIQCQRSAGYSGRLDVCTR